MGSAFNERRATQIAACFLSLAPHHEMREIRLVKFMYMADRVAIERWGYPLTWDRLARLPHGPVQSSVLNLANQTVESYDGTGFWREHIGLDKRWARTRCIPWCVLREPAGDDTLSDVVVDIINELYAEYKDKDIVGVVHALPEHRDPHGSSLPLPYEELLGELGFDNPKEKAKELENLAHVHAALDC